ncbi:Hypothetical Protein FCC1311_034862 [Hondaea fermentalgiana]|uniref:Uncharacterized protein n=1 Tax=Hondaea fermentalgiana TaxID=2315210 RepID=A0A2R5GHC1_9STRA|nr:Hypothetical Protein FCC1311_034862 [Hondaea fermentalgiana]|eukprot:GBG27264.1 Hypothetical Protein FCC1311_034862 [Hondaea fermentalgiana]
MQKASFLMREEVAHGVQVLGKLRDAGQVARLSGEKRAKVDALAQGTLRKCLMLVGRAEERRNAQEFLAWIVLVFQSVRACGLDLEVIMARACSADLSAYAAPALLYAVAQAFGASSASSQPSQANAQGTSTSGLNEAFLRMLTQVCRFALLCHTCEASQHVGISPESLSAAMASSADPLRAVLGKYSTCRAITEPVVEKSSRFASALSKVLQQLAYCSAEQGSLLCAPKMLAQLLVPFAEMGWLSRRRQVDDVGSARCPWRVTCSGVEATLEFMLQRGDRLGIQGCEVAFLFLKKTQDWPLGDHHFLLQIAALVLRCAAEPIVEASSKFAATTSRHTRDVPSISKSTLRDGKSHQPVEADDTPSMQHLHRLLRLFTDCLQGTFKADRRRGANAATPTAHGLAAALALQASGASSYLGRRRGGSRRARHLDASSSDAQALSVATQGWLHHESQSGGLYLGAHEKAVMDVVTGIAFAIFRLHAQEQAQGSIKPKVRQSLSARTMGSSEHQRQDIPMATNDFEAPLLKEELGRAAESCFARLGPSDLHWKTIWAVGSKQVFATGWSSSEFEVCAAVLRSAVACAAQNPSKLALRGMAAALHELAQDELTSVQQLLRQSQKYHPEVAASGEYTIAVYGARLSVFLVFLINASPESVLSPSHAEANANPLSMMSGSASQDTMVGQVASALLSLVQRACSARAVYELPLEVVLSWLPAVGVALGSAVDAISSAARSAILEILQSVAVRGSAVCEDADRNSNSHMNRPKFDSSAPGRRADMDAVTLRLLEVWHALFATGAAPGWMNEAFGDVCEIDPLPFSDTYTKDLMLMITQHHKLARQAAPSWFKPLIAARQLQAIGQSLEADLRANLLPFRTFPGSFMNGSEQAALSLASELIVPRLGSLTRAMDDYAIAWQTQHMSRRGAQDSLLRLAALQAGVPAPSAVISEDSGAAGSLGTAVHALQGLAEIFARFDCARGRLSAAFYMHSAALLLRESGDAWEAGNAFATVANCILGKSFDTEDSTGQDVSGAALHTTDALHISIAAAFLRECIASFALMGAHPEAHRIKAILEQVSGRGDRPSRAPSLAPMGPPDLQEAISYYFLVGRASTETHEHARHWGHASPKYRQVHPWARVALSTSLCVARVIANARGPLDEIGKAETALVERLQRGTGLALAEGRLEWETREVWEASSTNTAQKSRLVIQAVLNSLGPERDGAIGKEAFYVRRLWPVRQWQKTAPMLRCPGEFVLLPNALDETPRSGNASPLESAGRGLLNGAGAFEDSKPRPSASQILLRTQESLSPTVALCSCDATLLPDDGPSAEDLLRASPFGDPLGPLAPPPDLRLGSRDEEFYPRRQGEVEGEEEEVGDEVDVEMEFDDVDPIPPDYPPPGFANADDMRPPSNSPPGARGTGRVGPDLSQSQTFKAIDTFGLQQAQISETSVPGVVKIVDADRAKRGENPMLFRTDQPVELIAFVQALQAGQTQS